MAELILTAEIVQPQQNQVVGSVMADSLPTANLLRRISNDIFKSYDCTQLAILVDVGDDIVDALKVETTNVHEIAFGVFKKWSRKKGASGRTLYNALNNDPFEHLARKFKEDLLQAGTLW